SGRQRTIEVARQSATRDVRHRVDLLEERLQDREVRSMYGEKYVSDGRIASREFVTHAELHPLGHNLSGEGISICVKAGAGESHEQVAFLHEMRADDFVFLYAADDEPREIVVWRLINPGHFGSLAADEGATVLAATLRDASYDLLNNRRFDHTESDVVEKEE